jgi:hypothetical protein
VEVGEEGAVLRVDRVGVHGDDGDASAALDGSVHVELPL